MKLDFSLCTRATCELYSSWNTLPNTGNVSDCVSYNGDELCCICMAGDVSTRPVLFDPFNTSYDVLSFISDPANRALFPRAGDSSPLMLGFDWGVMTNDGIELPVIASFFLTLQQIITDLGLGIVPYGDSGVGGWFQALDAACNAGQCTPLQSQLQALPWPSETQDSLPPLSQDPYGRFRILNSPWKQVRCCALRGFSFPLFSCFLLTTRCITLPSRSFQHAVTHLPGMIMARCLGRRTLSCGMSHQRRASTRPFSEVQSPVQRSRPITAMSTRELSSCPTRWALIWASGRSQTSPLACNTSEPPFGHVALFPRKAPEMMEVFSSSILGRGADSLFRRDEKKPLLAVVPAMGIPGPGPALHAAVVASEKPDGALILTVTPFTDDDAAPSSNATLQTLLVSCASSA
jgi:hypothetical protein